MGKIDKVLSELMELNPKELERVKRAVEAIQSRNGALTESSTISRTTRSFYVVLLNTLESRRVITRKIKPIEYIVKRQPKTFEKISEASDCVESLYESIFNKRHQKLAAKFQQVYVHALVSNIIEMQKSDWSSFKINLESVLAYSIKHHQFILEDAFPGYGNTPAVLSFYTDALKA